MGQKNKNHQYLKTLWYIIVLCLFLLSIFYYQLAIEEKFFTTEIFFEHPGKLRLVNKTFIGPYIAPTKEGFLMTYNKKTLPIYYSGNHEPPHYGEVVVYGVATKEGYIKAFKVHNYNYNYIIYLLSFFAGIFVLFVFFKEWKITKEGLKNA
jgi:hypothetical protein